MTSFCSNISPLHASSRTSCCPTGHCSPRLRKPAAQRRGAGARADDASVLGSVGEVKGRRCISVGVGGRGRGRRRAARAAGGAPTGLQARRTGGLDAHHILGSWRRSLQSPRSLFGFRLRHLARCASRSFRFFTVSRGRPGPGSCGAFTPSPARLRLRSRAEETLRNGAQQANPRFLDARD